jgi:Flp pilus assembly protein TadG
MNRMPTGQKVEDARNRRRLVYSFSPDCHGSNAVEFAILAPVVCLLVIGILYYGLYLGIANSLQQISADTGRYAMVGRDATERNKLAGRWISDTARNYPLIVPSRLTFQTSETGSTLVVALSYDITYLPTPPPILSDLIAAPTKIERSATVYVP